MSSDGSISIKSTIRTILMSGYEKVTSETGRKVTFGVVDGLILLAGLGTLISGLALRNKLPARVSLGLTIGGAVSTGVAGLTGLGGIGYLNRTRLSELFSSLRSKLPACCHREKQSEAPGSSSTEEPAATPLSDDEDPSSKPKEEN